eukprot:scaffold1192_cov169-Amphora_coffeaeformis.AAC.8
MTLTNNMLKRLPSNVPTEVPTDCESVSSSSSGTATSWEHVPLVEPHNGHKTVLVTGGAGFIGSSVANALLARGDRVVIIDEMNEYYDVSLKKSNLAMLKEKYGEDQLKIYVGDVCDANSSSVYGGSKSTFFSEDETVDNPVSPYAASKKACELLAYTYHHLYKLNVTGLRFFTVYGPRGRPDMAPFKFVDRVSRGLTLQQFGDGSSSRDYTYIDDIVDGVIRAVDRPYPYQIFNLGKGSGTSLKEFIDLVQKHVGKKAQIQVLPDQPGDVPYTCADVSKAERLLGYESTVSFEEGIRRTVAWYRSTYGISNEDAVAESQTRLETNTRLPSAPLVS